MGPPPPLGALRVFVQHGTGLPPADLNGLADPYVKLTIRHMTRETRVVHECLNPVWDELVQFIGPIEDFRGSELVLRVCDRDVLKHDDAMGGCRVNLRELSKGQTAWSKCPPWQCPSSAPAPPQGAPGGSGQPGTPSKMPRPLGAQPLPRVLEPAASKAADFTAFDHVGMGGAGQAGHRHGGLRAR